MTSAMPVLPPDGANAMNAAAGGQNQRADGGDGGANAGDFSTVLANRVEPGGDGGQAHASASSKSGGADPSQSPNDPGGKPAAQQADKSGKDLPGDGAAADKHAGAEAKPTDTAKPSDKSHDTKNTKPATATAQVTVVPVPPPVKVPQPIDSAAATPGSAAPVKAQAAKTPDIRLPASSANGADAQAGGEPASTTTAKALEPLVHASKTLAAQAGEAKAPVRTVPLATSIATNQAQTLPAPQVATVNSTAAATNQTPAPPTVTTNIPVPVNQPGWDGALSQRVQWMVGQNIHSAHLHLNPPELGPVDVRVSVNHDQASVVFTAHHADVRDALGAAIPRLRDALGQQGLNLVNVNVSHHSFGQGQQSGGTAGGSGNGFGAGTAGTDTGMGEETATSVAVRASLGLVDYYA